MHSHISKPGWCDGALLVLAFATSNVAVLQYRFGNFSGFFVL